MLAGQSWAWLYCARVHHFYYAYQSEPPWPDPVGDPIRPRTLAAYEGPPLRVSEAVNRYVASLKPEENYAREDMWLKTVAEVRPERQKEELQGHVRCAFKEPFPEVALLTGAGRRT